MKFSYELKIPKERIAVLVGKGGKVKSRLEHELGISVRVDSSEGEIILSGDDSLKLKTGESVVTAIGRGFGPREAFLLLKPD